MSAGPVPFLAAAGDRAVQAWVDALQAAMPDEHIVRFDQLSAQDKLRCPLAIVANPDPAKLRELPQLQWVHSVWAGVERLVADLAHTPIHIVRLVDPQLSDVMAEAVLAWTLYLHRDMPTYARQQRLVIWQGQEYVRPQQRRVGLLGLGEMGAAAAQGLVQAGFSVSGWSRQRKDLAHVQCFTGADGLQTMLSQTDILICLLPLTPATRGLVDSCVLQAMPKGASVINFARGGVVVDADLRAALDGAHIAHAVLDVFEQEPLPPTSWHWQHDRVTVLPHVAAQTDKLSASGIVARHIAQYRQTGTLPHVVDKATGY